MQLVKEKEKKLQQMIPENERVEELEWREDPEGILADEMGEIETLVEILEEASCNLEEFE